MGTAKIRRAKIAFTRPEVKEKEMAKPRYDSSKGYDLEAASRMHRVANCVVIREMFERDKERYQNLINVLDENIELININIREDEDFIEKLKAEKEELYGAE